jgi:solute carrier family 29 (equilibrative nucleoside transporter), member 1/2/3
MTCYEAKMNTRRRNLAGFSLFFIGSFALIIVRIFFQFSKAMHRIEIN